MEKTDVNCASRIHDNGIMVTNDDASVSKKSAILRGYWKDPYIVHFVRTTEQKAPEINRGYFLRIHIIELFIKYFHQTCKTLATECQLINLGAGSDTLFWRLQDNNINFSCYIDIDFPDVVLKKASIVRSKEELSSRLDIDGESRGPDLHSKSLHIIGADLRNPREVLEKLEACHIQKDLPTLVITECVLVYMSCDQSSKLLQSLCDSLNAVAFVNYEQVNMEDKFGQVMVENLKHRMTPVPGLPACKSLDTQKARFVKAGCNQVDALMMSKYRSIIQSSVLQRMEKLELLDEGELLEQLLEHYCVVWASKGLPPPLDTFAILDLRS